MLEPLSAYKYLFLDRDGVINERIIDGYILDYKDFHFKTGVLEALEVFGHHFSRIFIVTNQQCIGKGLLSEEAFLNITQQMLSDISKNGGRIDKVYHSPYLKTENSPMRKPNTGMGLKAKEEYPEVDFSKSIMIGDSNSDMLFGSHLGMKNVFIDNHTGEPFDKSLIDLTCDSLLEFSHKLKLKQS